MSHNATTTVIVFDLNGVLIRYSPLMACKCFVKYNHKFKLLLLILNPLHSFSIFYLLVTESVIEKMVMMLFQKYSAFRQHKEFIMDLINCQIPIPKTMEIVITLKNKGYELGLFTNIGEHSTAKLKSVYPRLFEQFQCIIYSEARDNYVSKPALITFERLKNCIGNKSIIFIDDTKKNITIAQHVGLHTIHFISPKKLRCQLKELIEIQ